MIALVDPLTVIALTAGIVGIVAGLVQIVEYMQKRGKAKQHKSPPQLIPSADQASAPSHRDVLHNLPPRSEFIGRGSEKLEVFDALSSRFFLVSIDGIGGIGKTTLALEVVHECLRASEAYLSNHVPTFAAIVWMTAKGRDLTLKDILDTIAQTLEMRTVLQFEIEDKLHAIIRCLQDKKCLLVIDNFETIKDAAIQDFLVNLPEPSKAIITTRRQNLRQAYSISLKGLKQDEALTLIRSEGKRLGLSGVIEVADQILLRLYDATGGAPLALKWAMGQLKQRGQALNTILDHLHNAQGDIFELIFAQSWQLLTVVSRQVLVSMPAFATSASRSAIEAAADVHTWDLDDGVGQLVEMWLIEPNSEIVEENRRYSIHPLTRAFAEQKGKDNAEEYDAIHKRTAEFFLNYLREQIELDNQGGFKKLDEERENIYTQIEWGYGAKEWQLLVEFTRSIGEYLWLNGHWSDRIRYCILGVEACRYLKDNKNLAWLLVYDLGWTFMRQGNYTDAERCLEEGRSLFLAMDDKPGLALANRHLASLAGEDQLDRSEELALEAISISREIGDRVGIAYSEIQLARISRSRNNLDEADKHIEIASDIFMSENELRGLARVTFWKGLIAGDRRQSEKAKQLFLQSIEEAIKADRKDLVADCYCCLAIITHRGDHDPETALGYIKKAIDIYDQVGMRAPKARSVLDEIADAMKINENHPLFR